MLSSEKKLSLLAPEDALPGREATIQVSEKHFVNQNQLSKPFPEEMQFALFGMGCFWGAERKFWEMEYVYSSMVGYSAGYTQNPSYEEVCSGLTGHNEVVRVVYDPSLVSFELLLKIFWLSHNPTQGMRQGNDLGTQYRSGIYYYNEQQKQSAMKSRDKVQTSLSNSEFDNITTEIIPATDFYYAEDYHQQYLAKNPGGYCGLGGLNIPYSD
ncbi:Peptide-methionine (S)-S-oxide reductase MsrA [hydrothermal vent metagenome]|uniref:peptide-methionine (S)-S-oxide reductase n=1 Tax=hydrothermal vent metagenome TaxID=652676 RepID=A0A3B0YQY0_9ZZZZ